MLPEQKSSIQNIVQLFDEAEDKVKEVELLAQEISIPSINELRYVGYHLARSFCEDDPEKLDTQIDKATRHCKRAIYDAHEIGIIYMLEQIKLFKEKYISDSDSVIKIIPLFADDLVKVTETADFIAQVKGSCRNDRDEYYAQCKPLYLTLKKVFDKFNVSEALINQEIIKSRREDRKQTRRYITGTLIALLSIVITISVSGKEITWGNGKISEHIKK